MEMSGGRKAGENNVSGGYGPRFDRSVMFISREESDGEMNYGGRRI